MKVLELLDELEEIIDTSASFPLTGKIMVDADDVLSVVRDIRRELPEEINHAQYIVNEQRNIIDKARQEYTEIINQAKAEAERLIETDDITVKAKHRADEILQVANENAKQLKLSSLEYVDNMLYDFQNKMDSLNSVYFEDMFNKLQETFEGLDRTVGTNRDEIKDMIFKVRDED